MVRNYILIAVRSLSANRGYAAVSIVGLAISMTVCLLIITFVRHSWSHDTFHRDAGRIYHLYSDFKAGINPSSDLYGTTPATLGGVLDEAHPDIESHVTLQYLRGRVIRDGASIRLNGFYATPAFFKTFTFDVVRGNTASPLDGPNTAVLTEAAALRLFGTDDPVGATLTVDRVGELIVTGVLAKPTQQTAFDFDVLASFETLAATGRDPTIRPWHRTVRSHFTFVKLGEGADPADLAARLPSVVSTHYPPPDEDTWLTAIHARPLTGISSGPRMGNMFGRVVPRDVHYLFVLVAALILGAACFNYVGFSVARGLGRAREVGVRKVVGAGRRQIISQFLVESVCVALVSLGLAAIAIEWGFAQFTSFVSSEIPAAALQASLDDPSLWLIFLVFGIAVGLCAGAYPAVYLARFLPSSVLKGASGLGERGFRLRRALIVIQCALSLFFITTTILAYAQMRHVVNTDLGFNPQGLINVSIQGLDYRTVRAELSRHAAVTSVSGMSFMTDSGRRNDVWLRAAGIDKIKGYQVAVDEHAVENLDIRLLAGRSFTVSDAGRSNGNVLLNEAAVRHLGLKTPAEAIGQTLTAGDEPVTIVGVVGDFRYYSRVHRVNPLIVRCTPDEIQWVNVRFAPGTYAAVANHIRETWRGLNPDLRPQFDLFEAQLSNSRVVRSLGQGVTAMLAPSILLVVIACLGLLGMTAYAMQARRKEVGIRKVCGASTPSLVADLTRSYVLLIALATAVATPLAAAFADVWLRDFENRVALGPLPFVAAILILALVGLITVGSQTVMAARANPVDTLRHE